MHLAQLIQSMHLVQLFHLLMQLSHTHHCLSKLTGMLQVHTTEHYVSGAGKEAKPGYMSESDLKAAQYLLRTSSQATSPDVVSEHGFPVFAGLCKPGSPAQTPAYCPVMYHTV